MKTLKLIFILFCFRSFYTANDLKQQSESVLSSSSDSYSPESIDLNSENEKDPKAKILSDLSNTDYESNLIFHLTMV